jgi:hypothetical protein
MRTSQCWLCEWVAQSMQDPRKLQLRYPASRRAATPFVLH